MCFVNPFSIQNLEPISSTMDTRRPKDFLQEYREPRKRCIPILNFVLSEYGYKSENNYVEPFKNYIRQSSFSRFL